MSKVSTKSGLFSELSRTLPRLPDFSGKNVYRWVGKKPGNYRRANSWLRESGVAGTPGVPSGSSDLAAIDGRTSKVTYSGLPELRPLGIGVARDALLKLISGSGATTSLQTSYLVNLGGRIEITATTSNVLLKVLKLWHNAGLLTLGSRGFVCPALTGTLVNAKDGRINILACASLNGDLENSGDVQLNAGASMGISGDVTCVADSHITFGQTGILQITGALTCAADSHITLSRAGYGASVWNPGGASISGTIEGCGCILGDTTFKEAGVLRPGTSAGGGIVLKSLTMNRGSRLVIIPLATGLSTQDGITIDDGVTVEIVASAAAQNFQGDLPIATSAGPLAAGKVNFILPTGVSCSGLAVQDGMLVLKGFSNVP